MRVVLGSDHAGYELKQQILEYVKTLGHEVLDVGTHDNSSVDYPDFAEAVGKTIINNEADRGILLCGSGEGHVLHVGLALTGKCRLDVVFGLFVHGSLL